MFPPLQTGDGHSSRRHITVPLQRPTRKLWRTEPARTPRKTFLPYLVLLRVGFAMRRVLLRVRCALTAPFHPYPPRGGRYLLCGTFRRTPLTAPSRTLSGTLLCGVRTFLCLATAIVRSGCQPSHYSSGCKGRCKSPVSGFRSAVSSLRQQSAVTGFRRH